MLTKINSFLKLVTQMLMLSNLVFRLMSNFDFCRHPVKNPVSLERLLRSVDILDTICERNFEKKIRRNVFENIGKFRIRDISRRQKQFFFGTYRNPNLIFVSNPRRFLLRQSVKFFICCQFLRQIWLAGACLAACSVIEQLA